MPDFGTPVAQNVKGPDLSTLSGILDIQQKQQSLASGAIGIQRAQQQLTGTGANEAQSAQQTMQERGVITKMMQSGKDDRGNSVMGADGEHDLSKLLPALGRMAPLTGQHYAKTILDTHQAKLGVQTAGLSLDSNQRAALMGPLQAVAANPGDPSVLQNVSGSLDSWAAAHPEMAGLVNNVKTTLLPHIQNAKPEERAKMANSMAAMLQGGQAVQTQPQGAAVNDGQTLQQGTTAPPVAGGGFTPKTSTQQQPGPTIPTVDPATGQQTMYGARPPMSAKTAAVVTGLGPMASANITQASGIRQTANAAARTYPDSQFNNNQIIKLAQSPNALGEGGSVLSKLGGQWAGIPWTSDMSTNYNNIGHFMELQAMSQMKAAGLAGTDADKSLSRAITGNQTYTAPSIVNIARVNRGLSEGVRLFNEGIEHANATGNPADITTFSNKWSSIANVDSFMLYNAKKHAANDASGFEAVVKDLGGRESPRYKAALHSIDEMRGLIKGEANGKP